MQAAGPFIKRLRQPDIQLYRKLIQYLFHVKNLDMPFYQHIRGQTPDYNKAAWLRMMQKIREAGEKRHK